MLILFCVYTGTFFMESKYGPKSSSLQVQTSYEQRVNHTCPKEALGTLLATHFLSLFFRNIPFYPK